MTRIEFVASGFGAGRFQVQTFPQLRGKTVLGVYKDGIGCTKITVTTDILAPLPTGKHARFNPNTGSLAVSTIYEKGETTVILYQDIPN